MNSGIAGSVHRLSSPVGTTGCSQGRQPLDAGKRNAKAPQGRQELEDPHLPPLRGLRANTSSSPGADAPGYILPPLRG
jgi:hypothetical protein